MLYKPRQLILLGAAFVALLAVFFFTQQPAAPPRGYVSRAMLGAAWPLTVEDGTLACTNSAVTFTTHGTAYAVNGIATQRGAGIDITPIWADDTTAGLKKDIGPLLDRGRALC